CLLLWNVGVFEQFWFWTIKYAGQYGSQVSIADGLRIFANNLPNALGTAWPIWGIAASGLVMCMVNRTLRTRAVFLTTFAFFSILAVCPGFYFRPHYFILVLPAVSLLAGLAVAAALDTIRFGAQNFRFVVLLLFGFALAWPMWAEADFFFERPLAEANRMVNGTNPFPESIKIGEYIRAQSSVSDTIAVLGSEPQIYFYSKRHSATGYIYTYELMEPQSYARQMQEEMIQQIESARPKYLIWIGVPASWLQQATSEDLILAWANDYVGKFYDVVGLVNLLSRDQTDYYFDQLPESKPQLDNYILICRRKS